jgi:UDP-glucose 4-epimerase
MILVVGGAGYIGSHTVSALSKKFASLLILDNLAYGHKEFLRWGQFILGDIQDKDQLSLLFKTYPIRAVLHFSSFIFVGESVTNPQKYYQNNLANSLNLLSVMLKHNVKKLIFSSTAAVYGNPLSDLISEDHPLNPINPYGQSKLMLEKVLSDYDKAYGLKSVVLRYFNASGANANEGIGEWHDPETHLIPLILDTAIGARSSLKVFGTDYPTADGTCVRDYIHVSDLAEAHVLSLEHLLSGGDSATFNLGYGHGFSVKEVIACAAKVTGKKIPVEYETRREGDPAVLVASSNKIRQALNWRPRLDNLERIIESAWHWHCHLVENFRKNKY